MVRLVTRLVTRSGQDAEETGVLQSLQRAVAPASPSTRSTGVPYLDSSGLGSLVSSCISCQKAGRRMALTGVNQRVMKVFQITKTEPLFLMFPTLSDALEAFTNAGTA